MSRLVWNYEGEEEELHGEQCVLVGDTVVDDVLGEGTAVRTDGAFIVVEFLEDGERVEKPRTKGHVRARQQRERVQQQRTGKRAADQRGMMEMLTGKDAPVGAAQAPKRQRGGAFGTYGYEKHRAPVKVE